MSIETMLELTDSTYLQKPSGLSTKVQSSRQQKEEVQSMWVYAKTLNNKDLTESVTIG